MAFSPNLLSSMKKTFSSSSSSSKLVEPSKKTNNKITTDLKIIAKNFLVLPNIARDISVTRRNFDTLVKMEGGKPSGRADKFFMKEDEKERALEEERRKQQAQRPTAAPKKQDEKGIISRVIGIIVKSILIAVAGIFVLGDVIASIFKSIGEAITSATEYLKELGRSFISGAKEIFDKIFESIKTFYEETIQPIVDEIKAFFEKIINVVVDFVRPIIEFISTKIAEMIKFLEPIFTVLGNIFTKAMEKVEFLKNKLDSLKNSIKNFFGYSDEKKQKGTFKGVPDGEDKLVKEAEVRRAKQKEKEETERVRQLEKEKQYTGKDEIVRSRLGLPDKTETMRREEEERRRKTEAAAPPKEPTPPAPPPPKTPTQIPAAKPSAPSAAPAPTPSAPPGAQKPTAEPAKVPGGTPGLVVSALNDAGITSPKAHANILATVKAESSFKPKNESLFYKTPEQIMKVFGKRRIPSIDFARQFVSSKGDNRSELLANHVYKSTDGNSEPGDGFKYRGRGFIQHTGKNQYKALTKGSGIDLLSNPDALNSPEVAAKVIPWFFLSYKNMKPEDLDNMSKVNKAVAFADDATGTKAKAREASAQEIYASMSSDSGTQMASASSDVASGQRQQMKPQTPVVVNAPTTNTQVNTTKQVAAAPRKDVGSSLTAAAA